MSRDHIHSHTEPDPAQIDALLAYLPALEALGGKGTARWEVPAGDVGGATIAPFPVNADIVHQFIGELDQACWMDADYDPHHCERYLTPEYIGAASLSQLRELLTYIVRGERFCDGWWDSMVRDGHIQRVLRRLSEL